MPERGFGREKTGPVDRSWILCYLTAMAPRRDPLKVGLIQTAASADAAANLKKAAAMVRDAAARGAQVVCLEELFLTPYFCQKEDAAFFDLAEPVPGPTTEALARAAKELGIVLLVPVFERRAPGVCHNSAAVIDADGAVLGVYRKMHIPDDPVYYEKL